jgi:plasmid stabilization system protein ParE
VAQIVYSENALTNLERVFDFLAEHEPQAVLGTARSTVEAVDALSNHPLIGRTVAGELRELVISYGKTGYIALYRFLPAQDLVRILAIRHQRELDYPID